MAKNIISGQCAEGQTAYAIINTAEFSSDGRWDIHAVSFSRLRDLLSLDEYDLEKVKRMAVGDMAAFDFDVCAKVVRLA